MHFVDSAIGGVRHACCMYARNIRYCFVNYYVVPLVVGMSIILLFLPPLVPALPPAYEGAWFWTRVVLIMLICYITIVLTSNRRLGLK